MACVLCACRPPLRAQHGRGPAPRDCRAAVHETDDRQLFQITATRRNTPYDDVRAASEMCDLLTGPSRVECYASFGLSAYHVDKYLGKALSLEAALRAAEPDDTITVSTPFGGHLHIPRPHLPPAPHMPHMPHMPAVPSVDVQATFESFTQATAASRQHVERMMTMLAQFHEELRLSRQLMFDEDDAHEARAQDRIQQ